MGEAWITKRDFKNTKARILVWFLLFSMFCLEKKYRYPFKKRQLFFLSEQNRGFVGVLGITTAYNKVFEGIIHGWLLDKKVLQTYNKVHE